MRSFYWRWLRTAFTRALGPIDLWTGLVAAIVGIVDHYWPGAQLLSAFGWQIGIWVLAAVMVVRLVLAPYWMWQELRDRIDALEARLVPQLAIEFDPNNSLCVHETWFRPDREDKALYVAVVPRAFSETSIKGCVGYLNTIWHRVNGDWKLTPFTNRQALEWGAVGIRAVDIDNRTNQPLNVFFVKKRDPRIHPLVGPMLNKDKMIFHEKSSEPYRFEIVVVSESGASASILLQVQLGDEWTDLKVQTV